MAMVAIPSWPILSIPPTPLDTSSIVMDAAGESVGIVGQVWLAAGIGSKTISSSGGKIYWRSAAVAAFTNAGTNVRVGLQDVVVTTGLEDGTFDVYGDLVGGTDTIAAASFQLTTMDSGTKTLTHGDVVAIVIEMTARGGADSVGADRVVGNALSPASANSGFPYGTIDTGTHMKALSVCWAVIVFDDATLGWIRTVPLIHFSIPSTISFNSGSTPDEYIGTFTVPVPMQISGIGIGLGSVATGETFEVILYSNPYGTPSVIQAVAADPDLVMTGAGTFDTMYGITPVTLSPGTVYGIALRPTSVGNITVGYVDLGSGFHGLKGTLFLADVKLATRTDNVGAFTELQTHFVPLIALSVTGLEDGTGGGGGAIVPQTLHAIDAGIAA